MKSARVTFERIRWGPTSSFPSLCGRDSSELCTRLAPLNLRATPSPHPSPPPRGRGCPNGAGGGSWAGRKFLVAVSRGVQLRKERLFFMVVACYCWEQPAVFRHRGGAPIVGSTRAGWWER